MSQIRNRRILITGAACGMGRIMAEQLSSQGAEVLLTDIDERPVQSLAAELTKASAYVCDVRSRKSVDALRRAVSDVDILINNAGIISTGAYTEIAEDADERMIGINAAGVHWVTKAFLPDLIASPEGHLVMMASVASIVGVPYQALYSATKWFVAGLGESIRQELRADGHHHVHVTIVCPSIVDTGFYREVKAPLLVPILSPERVVDRTLSAIESNKPYVREPFLVKLAPFLRGVLPSRAVDTIARVLGVGRAVPRTPA